MFAMASVSAMSPEVLRYYAAARDASSNVKYDEARAHYAKAIELDPKFGIGYQGLAAIARNQIVPTKPRSTSRKRFAIWMA